MNYLDLFSGIGGFPVGAHRAGMKFENHYFSEVDPWAVDLYQKRFPDAIPLGDIRGIDGKILADAKRFRGDRSRGADFRQGQFRDDESGVSSKDGWILTGGFPCQDISFAGAGAGLAGKRSGLWYEFHRIIGELRPRYVIVENVAALFTRGIDRVLGSLAEIGYDAEWETIRASDMGAPHKRERVWIVAYPNEQHDDYGRYGTSEVCGERYATAELSRGEDVANTDSQQAQRVTESWGECDHWSTEPDVGRLAHGVPHRVDRLRGLGNTIVPQIAELIFRQIRPDHTGTVR